MLFDQSFLDTVSDDPILAILNANKCYWDVLEKSDPNAPYNEYELECALETFALVTSILEAHKLQAVEAYSDITGDAPHTAGRITTFLRAITDQYEAHFSSKKLEAFKRKFQDSLGARFAYEFSQGDLDRIQTLLNDLRVQISASTLIDEEHKSRLLKRLERLQAEMHKRISDLDRFWGLIGDAGVVAGKFGKDVKPIVDRIREVADIVWRTQSRAEELPSDTPRFLLGNDTSGDQS